MTTQLTKPVKRRTEETRRDKGKLRRYVITLYPGGLIGFRLEKTRREELLPVAVAFETAVRLRVADERAKKLKARGIKFVKRGKI